jgi:transcriptional regulator with XRE-family HTH domain
VKLGQLKTNDEVLAEQLGDPEFRAEWERTALARALAIAVLQYRTERGLSQRALAEQLGWKQPAVARLELGEHNPSYDTLLELAQKLGLELVLDITPKGMAGRWFTPRPVRGAVIEDIEMADGMRVAFGARPAAALIRRRR